MTQARAGRTLLLALTALSLAANAGACSSDDSAPADGGNVVVPRPDGSAASGACEPLVPPALTFVPPPAYQAKCTDAELERVLKDCVFEDATDAKCQAVLEGTRPCFECMFGTFASTPAHPLVLYSDVSGPRPSSGTCMSNVSGDTDPDGCAVAFGLVETCAFTACTQSCAGATEEQTQACYEQALGTVCTAGLERFNSKECADAYASKAYATCVTGENPSAPGTLLTNYEYFYFVSKLACGARPAVDAGETPDAAAPADAGTDADAG